MNKYNFSQFDLNCDYNINNKSLSISYYIKYMLARTQQIFSYEGLPETISKRNLELMLQSRGHVCIAKVEDKLYAFCGAFGGEPDPYYMPTLYTVANPALNLSQSYVIGEDCIIIPNDGLYLGLLPLFTRYATQLTENDISMNVCDINTRIISLISASDDRTLRSAEEYLKKVEDGKLGVIAETALLDGVRSQPLATSTNNTITNLIEYEQYLKASWYNDLGLQANYNMKRESINSNEAQLNEDALLPLIDEMFEQRKLGLDKVNEMFGTNITIKLSSSWEDNYQELELAHSMEAAQCNSNLSGVVEGDEVTPETDETSVQEEDIVSIPEETIENIVEVLEEELDVNTEEDDSDVNDEVE